MDVDNRPKDTSQLKQAYKYRQLRGMLNPTQPKPSDTQGLPDSPRRGMPEYFAIELK
jgi:hypothetical protein